jgi:murein DD-endopeptidase MepM/ murein hydrolase activator NlpD
MKYFLVIFLSLLPLTAAAVSAPIISNLNPLQGDTVVLKFLDNGAVITSAAFDGRPALFFKYRGGAMAVFGIPASKPPGQYLFRADFKNGETYTQTINVKAKVFPRVVLGIPKEVGLDSKDLVKHLEGEKINIDALVAERSAEIFWDGSFGLPLSNNKKITSPYGEIRQTGDTEIRHLGVDFGANLGAAVGAINGGRVVKAYYDTVYGNSVILDHGQGIYSLYLHLQKMKVKEGDLVKKGQVLGTVGKSGYATAPHLHLSLKVGGVSVDPIRFISIFK